MGSILILLNSQNILFFHNSLVVYCNANLTEAEKKEYKILLEYYLHLEAGSQYSPLLFAV